MQWLNNGEVYHDPPRHPATVPVVAVGIRGRVPNHRALHPEGELTMAQDAVSIAIGSDLIRPILETKITLCFP